MSIVCQPVNVPINQHYKMMYVCIGLGIVHVMWCKCRGGLPLLLFHCCGVRVAHQFCNEQLQGPRYMYDIYGIGAVDCERTIFFRSQPIIHHAIRLQSLLIIINVHIITGTEAATLPTSSSAWMIFLMRAAGNVQRHLFLPVVPLLLLPLPLLLVVGVL